MIILHISDISVREGNGVVNAISQYAQYEGNNNEVAIYNLNQNIDNNVVPEYNYKDYNKISLLPSPFNKPDIVVFNEVYKLKYIKFSNECRKLGIKYVIIPHGCLTDIARNKKGTKLKKQIALSLLLKNFINRAEAIQYLNDMEKNNTHLKIKKYIISGNGIDVSQCLKNRCKDKKIIYIGRYDIYHKGLDYLLELCKKYQDWFIENNIVITLYGRDSKGDVNLLKQMIKEYNINNILILQDAVYGIEKSKVLQEAYAFIQTSRSEGQPMGIIEALGCGIPCIVTDGTSFAEYVNKNKCGFGSKLDVDKIFNNLKIIVNDKKLRDEMSFNASKCIKRDFDWNVVIDDCIKKYHDLIS